ncbi:MAG: histidinol-phosphatase, partial [Candidatus Hydrogenedentes bacterium]|nr:histidinol-phosphatase [Candidatus Hydrogenedentota bacterium]
DIRWIIDPIDGTRAFVSGVPAWGILIGLTENNRCLAGLMHQPFTGETFVGGPDGAYVHRNASTTKLEARADAELDTATIYCTHPMMFEHSEHREAFQNLSAHCRLQRFGGDCYSYCLLAHGCIDLVVEGFLQAYDIVPLVPIVERAGGVITDIDGNAPMNGGTIIAAANARLHETALKMMNE